MQIFLADDKFKKYLANDLAIWTESYGGHYGPTFASYFLDQNGKIDDGSVEGAKLNLKFLGVGDGLTDPLNQFDHFCFDMTQVTNVGLLLDIMDISTTPRTTHTTSLLVIQLLLKRTLRGRRAVAAGNKSRAAMTQAASPLALRLRATAITTSSVHWRAFGTYVHVLLSLTISKLTYFHRCIMS